MKNGIGKLEFEDVNTAETDEQDSQALNLFFSYVFQNETLDNIPSLNFHYISDGVCLPVVLIASAAVFSRLKTLNPTKSEGPDRISPMVLLEIHRFLYIPLMILLNKYRKRIYSL